MAWVKLDDQFFINRKARAAGLEGRALAAASWCYCAMQRNDGIFPADDVPIIAAMAGVPQEIGDRLVEVGLWHARDDGTIEVHDYLEHNLSNEQMIARSEKASKAAAARYAPSTAPSSPASEPPGMPIPSPSPVPDTSSSSSSTVDLGDVPAEVWTTIADQKLQAARDKGITVGNPSAWRRKVIENDKAELGPKALEVWNGWDITPSQLASYLNGSSRILNTLRRKEAA